MKYSTALKILTLTFLTLILFLVPQKAVAQKASFYLSPGKGSYGVGSTFFVNLLVNVDGIAINAAQATASFPADKLQVIQVSKVSSIFSLWPEEPVFSNTHGRISFLGGVPSPGFIGQGGNIISILFKAKAAGEATVSFSGEKILANDPYGTDIFAFSQGGIYTIIIPEKLPPTEKPPIEKLPPEEAEADTQPPHTFEITIDNEGDPTNPTPLLYFETKDDLSGMSHYEAKIKDDVFEVRPGENFPWRTPVLVPDTYNILVKAFDRAGNFTESRAEMKIESIPPPQVTVCPKTFRSGEEMLFVSGTALPNSKLIILFEKEGKLIKEWEISSDHEGDWSLAKEGLFRSGVYTISAKTKDSRGAESYRSGPCTFKVILEGISIGPLIISYKNLSLITIIIFIILLLFILYLLWRIKRTHKLIERESKDLRLKFYKEFNELKNDIESRILGVKKIRDVRSPTQREKVTEEELLKDLADVERVLREELQDIEEIE